MRCIGLGLASAFETIGISVSLWASFQWQCQRRPARSRLEHETLS